MTGLAAGFVLGSFALSLALVRPASRRSGLDIWHPAVAWLALELVFFGLGSIILAVIDQRPGPALYVGGGVLVFALAVATSDRIARVRAGTGGLAPEAPGPIRPWAVALLVLIGLVALLPTILTVGIPFLSGDITAARSEVGGLDLQILRVALPAAAVVVALRATAGRPRLVAVAVIGLIAIAELAIASRYLAAELAAALVIGLALRRRPISGQLLAAAVAVSVVLFAAIGILRAYDQAAGRELDFAVGRTINRVLMIQPRTLDALQAVIPAEQPHFDGLTWARRLGPLFGRDDIPNLGYWIYPRLFPDQAVPGYAATGLIGEAWANFGWFGLAMFAVLGVFVERVGAWIALRRTAFADIAAAALLTLFIARTHALGLNGLLVLLAFAVIWRVVVASPVGLGREARTALSWRL